MHSFQTLTSAATIPRPPFRLFWFTAEDTLSVGRLAISELPGRKVRNVGRRHFDQDLGVSLIAFMLHCSLTASFVVSARIILSSVLLFQSEVIRNAGIFDIFILNTEAELRR